MGVLRWVVLVAVGLVLGYGLGELAGALSSGLGRVATAGFPLTLPATTVGLPGFHVTFGFAVTLNLANVAGVLLALWLARRVGF